MVTYPITRFLIEYLRNDEGVFFAGMTISQNISVVLVVCGLAVLVSALRGSPRRTLRGRRRRVRASTGRGR